MSLIHVKINKLLLNFADVHIFHDISAYRDVVTNVSRALCWYEFLHKTKTDVNQFLRCDNQVQKIKNGYTGVPDVSPYLHIV